MIPPKIREAFDYISGDEFANGLINFGVIEYKRQIQFNRYSDTKGRIPETYLVWNWVTVDEQHSMRGTVLSGIELSLGLYVKDGDTLESSVKKAEEFRTKVFDVFQVLAGSKKFRIEIGGSLFTDDDLHGCVMRLQCL